MQEPYSSIILKYLLAYDLLAVSSIFSTVILLEINFVVIIV